MDISGVTSIAKLSRKDFMDVAQQTAVAMNRAAYEQIRLEANGALSSTRQIYKRNINQPVMGRLKGTITLTGQLPNMLEQGATAYDLKKGFERSKKVKKNAKGDWYLTIPFRHAAAGGIGESSAFSGGVMPTEVYNIAKRLKASTTVPFGGGMGGGRISMEDLKATKFGVLGVRKGVSTQGTNLTFGQAQPYTHKSPIHQGIGRSSKFYEKVSQSKYTSFRRVGKNSDPNSWIHKGFKARNLFQKALQNTDFGEIVSVQINNYLTANGL